MRQDGLFMPYDYLTCGFILVLLFVNAGGQPLDATFQLSSRKWVNVKMDEFSGAQPRIVFGVGEHKHIVPVGPPHTIRDRPEGSDGFPLRSRAISLPSMKEPLVLVYSAKAGASDCTYSITPIGIKDGELPQFVPSSQVAFSNEGGLAIWAAGLKTEMVVWSPIWARREGHYDAHRYRYFWYSWNPSRYKFQYTRSTESRKRLNSAEESLNLSAHSAVEISYRTRADWFPEAADGC
jgi:hypothetical protein